MTPRDRALLPPDDPRHGTSNGYGNLRCRCEACRRGNRLQHAEYMSRVRASGQPRGEHGGRVAYDSGCRCDVCRDAHNERSREYYARRRAR